MNDDGYFFWSMMIFVKIFRGFHTRGYPQELDGYGKISAIDDLGVPPIYGNTHLENDVKKSRKKIELICLTKNI